MKIIQVINAMITKRDKITNVIRNREILEFYFLFDNKYKWSIMKSKEGFYFLHFYPTDDLPIDRLVNITEWEDFSYVTYSTKDINTTEALQSFEELYQIVSNKLYNLDGVFDDILQS